MNTSRIGKKYLRSGILDQIFDNGVRLNIPPILGSHGRFRPEVVVMTQSIVSLRFYAETFASGEESSH